MTSIPTAAVRRLAELCRAYAVPHAADALAVLIGRLALEEAPTGVHAPREVVDLHVADSLVALDVPEMRAATEVHDLGSGAGLPGLVLAACLPAARVTLVEATSKKATFIAETAEAMGVTNAAVVWSRAESWREGLESADVVLARALASLAVVSEYAAPLLRPGGRLIAWKGALDATERADALAAAEILGLSPPTEVAVRPFPASEHRTLQVLEKVGPTPARFPRREGMATKRPLTATASR